MDKPGSDQDHYRSRASADPNPDLRNLTRNIKDKGRDGHSWMKINPGDRNHPRASARAAGISGIEPVSDQDRTRHIREGIH
jgi:hypothetical protein